MAGRIAGLTAAAAAMAIALGPARAAQPSLTPAQVVALFGAAGFPLGPNKRPVNRRRQPANPKVSFVDMNGDGQLEALFIDEGPCYKPDGRWYAVAAQSPGGAWRRILEGEGSLHATDAASRGWFVLAATSAGRTKELRYDGHVYASADHAPGAAPAPADRAQDGDIAPAADAEPAPKGGRYPTDGWKAPVKFAQLSPAEQASIMTAARYQARRQGLEGLRRLVERRQGRSRHQGSERRRPAGSRHHRFQHRLLRHGGPGLHHHEGGSGRLEEDGAGDRDSDVSR